MNDSKPSYGEVMQLLKQFKDNEREEYALLSLGVFGSFARQEEQADSDIDIVFETDRPNLFRTARMQADLEELLQRRVDVVRLRDNMNPQLKKRILRDVHYV